MKKLVFLFLALFSFSASGQLFYALSVTDDFSSIPKTPFPGDTVSLIVNIQNISSNRTVFDVNASIEPNDSLFEPVDVFEHFDSISSDSSKQIAFRFVVKEDVLAGLYRFPLTLSYLNGNNIVTDSFDVNLLVNECFRLDVGDISYSPEKVYAGKTIIISAQVENVCSGNARDVSVEFSPVTNSSFDPFLLLSSNVLELGNIAPSESENVSFVLQPISNADQKIYVFELKAKCLDCKSETSDKVSFEVLGKPWVIVSGTDLSVDARADAKNLMQGDNFSFSVQVDNIGKEKAKAVKVLLETSSSIDGVKEAFIGNIDPDDSSAAVFDLTVKPDAGLGGQPVKIMVGYFDETDSIQVSNHDFVFFINARAPESPVLLLVVLIVFLLALYFVLRLVFRQLSLRKAKLQ